MRTLCASSSARMWTRAPALSTSMARPRTTPSTWYAPEGSPVSSIDTNEIVFNSDINDDPAKQIKIKNEGSGQLDLNHRGLQPPVPPPKHHSHLSRSEDGPSREASSVAPAKQDKNRVSPATNEDPFVLTYAGDYKAATGAAYQSVRFSHYYPARTALAAIKGMKISSIDVYLIDAAKEKSEVCIWKGSLLRCTPASRCFTARKFTPLPTAGTTSSSRNRPLSPLRTTSTSVYASQVAKSSSGKSVSTTTLQNLGYGDLMSYGNSPTWWSLADLGADARAHPCQCHRRTHSGCRLAQA